MDNLYCIYFWCNYAGDPLSTQLRCLCIYTIFILISTTRPFSVCTFRWVFEPLEQIFQTTRGLSAYRTMLRNITEEQNNEKTLTTMVYHIFMVFDGRRWITMVVHQIPSSTMVNWPWQTTVDHSQLWLLMVGPWSLIVRQLSTLNYHGWSWTTMKYHGQPWITMVEHELPWSTMNYCGWPWTTMVDHGSTWILAMFC